MSDTRIKTLGELARELRTEVGAAGQVMDEAAERLEQIEKAWAAFDGMTQGNYSEARRRVRAAITGKES